MYKKIVLILMLFIIIVPITALADCDECSTSNCEKCGCVLNTEGNKCVYQNFDSGTYSCGTALISNIPSVVPKITHIIYNVIHIAVPVLLVIFGSIDLIKSVVSGKDDEIKKNQATFIRRLISAAIVFFVFAFVKFFISVVNDKSTNMSSRIINCMECFIEKKCSHYKP